MYACVTVMELPLHPHMHTRMHNQWHSQRKRVGWARWKWNSLAPPLRRAGEGERAEESGDTAIQSVAERNAIIGS